jgi:exosortase A-associated hydrolase 1
MGEVAFRFVCEGSSLLGVLHQPAQTGDLGVLMFVGGGPQFRVGGHRQLVLWARALAKQGVSVMRFDYRGVGDSGGHFRGFDDIEADTRAAIAEFLRRAPAVKRLILWGECDASSAIMMHAHKEPKVVGISLQNPWARTAEGQAKTYIKHYYLHRLTERSFWKRVLQGKFNPFASVLGIARHALQASGGSPDRSATSAPVKASYVDRMKLGYRAFNGKVLLYMSGRDLIAREFDVLVAADKEWSALMRRTTVRRIDLPLADHTFSSAEMRQSVLDSASEWIRAIGAGPPAGA